MVKFRKILGVFLMLPAILLVVVLLISYISVIGWATVLKAVLLALGILFIFSLFSLGYMLIMGDKY
jgi:hypothetical protein